MPSFVPLIFRNALILLLLGVPSAGALAQNPASAPLPDFIIPPPPKLKGAPGQPDHQARMSESELGKAYDWTTKRHLHWDCKKKTWVDDWSGEEVGYDGFTGENGEIIPPPPVDYHSGAQAKQSMADPTHAVDAKTGQDLKWDAEAKTWRDTKTGKDVGFHGWRTKICPDEIKSIDQMAREDAAYERARSHLPSEAQTGDGPVQIEFHYEFRNFYNWKDVSGDDPSVSTNDASSSTNGVGGSIGYKFGGLPFYATVGGYYAGGLTTDATLTNGRSVTSDVDDFGFGVGARLVARPFTSAEFYASIKAMYERNHSTYKEFNGEGSLVLSESRDHSSWAGVYGIGGTYWVLPRIGIDVGASYQGQFNSMNADENFTLSTGLVLRLGEHR